MRFTCLIFAIGLLCGYSHDEVEIEVSEKDWNQAVLAFEELKEALTAENGKTWNYQLYGPIMLVNRDSRTFIANETDEAHEFIKKENYYVGTLPENINIANTAFDWKGKRWTMVFFPLPDTKEERLHLLIHESFHRIQPFIGFDTFNEILNAHLDSKDGRVFLKLELEALIKALNSNEPDVDIKNALLFRNYRYQVFPDAKNAENSLEILEGLAEYTGAILSQRSESDMKQHFISAISVFYKTPTFVRSFPYYTISLYGYFMQQKDSGWNLKITKNSNLTDFMNEFWGFRPKNLLPEEIAQWGKRYGIDSVMAFETQREIEKTALIQSYKSVFLSDCVVEMNLENMNIGFNPGTIVPLDTLGTVYPNLRLTDNWGILEVDSCGALISPRWDKVTISCPDSVSEILVFGRGWRLRINDGWKMDRSGNRYKVTQKK